MVAKKMSDVSIGEYFTKKPVEYPKESQVFIRRGYDRSSRKYLANRFTDVNDYRLIKGETIVYVDFIF